MVVLMASFCVCSVCLSSPALSQMGYNLSPQLTQLLVSRYCPRSANPSMQLDRFIQVCTQLQVLTEAFREKDTAVQGRRLGLKPVSLWSPLLQLGGKGCLSST